MGQTIAGTAQEHRIEGPSHPRMGLIEVWAVRDLPTGCEVACIALADSLPTARYLAWLHGAPAHYVASDASGEVIGEWGLA